MSVKELWMYSLRMGQYYTLDKNLPFKPVMRIICSIGVFIGNIVCIPFVCYAYKTIDRYDPFKRGFINKLRGSCLVIEYYQIDEVVSNGAETAEKIQDVLKMVKSQKEESA